MSKSNVVLDVGVGLVLFLAVVFCCLALFSSSVYVLIWVLVWVLFLVVVVVWVWVLVGGLGDVFFYA